MTPLERAQARMREMREQGNPNSLRLAITAKCFECLGGQDAKNIRQEIRECTSTTCPLYPVRPYQ
jgi:hypothetical protein